MNILDRLKAKTVACGLIAVGLFLCHSMVLAAKPVTLSADLGYVNVSSLPGGSDQINPIRLQALQETSMELGARGALAWQSRRINESLTSSATHLDHIFNFNQLLIDHTVLPPVITQSENDLNLDDNKTIRAASKIYEIVSNARFVTAAPTWRSYLFMDYAKPDLPSQTLLPHSQPEARVWNTYIAQGWQQGVEQANEIFRENLSRLNRDYNGMLLYNKLLAQHIVSKPFVAKMHLGVTGDSHQIRIDDQVLRITAESELQTDSSRWTPVVTQ